ncbi:hypothetical protein BH09BAC4_BH09BAC4_52010 [soil metagenome]
MEEVVQKGFDLVTLSATLLEKIEELTLYSIQLEKTNQQQAKKLQAIEQHHWQELAAIRQKQAQLEQLVQQVLNRKQ